MFLYLILYLRAEVVVVAIGAVLALSNGSKQRQHRANDTRQVGQEGAPRTGHGLLGGGVQGRLQHLGLGINPFFPTIPTCAVRETASLGIMGASRVLSLNPSETIVL